MDLVTSLVIDGLVINMVNLWKDAEINAGDDLMLHIVNQPCEEYVLSHYPGSASTQRFPRLDSEHIYQLVPAVSSSSDAEVQRAIWKEGYWHIARSQVMRYQHERSSVTSGNLLQVTFEPVWMDGREAFDGREVAAELPAPLVIVSPLPPLHVAHRRRRRAGIRALMMIVDSLGRLADDFTRVYARVCAHDDAAVHAARAVKIAGIIDGLAQLMSRLGKPDTVDLAKPDTAALEDTRVEAALKAALEDTRSVIGGMQSLIECVIAVPAAIPPIGSRCESQNIKRRLNQFSVRVTGLQLFIEAKEDWTRLHAVVLPVLHNFNSATVADDEIATYFEEHIIELAMETFVISNEHLTEDMFNYARNELHTIVQYMKQLNAMQRGDNTDHSNWKDAASYEIYTWCNESYILKYVFTGRKLTMALLGLCNTDERRDYVQARLSEFAQYQTEKDLDECISALDMF